MGRKKLFPESQILEAKRRIDNKEISLGAMAREMGYKDHKGLRTRIDNLNNQSTIETIYKPPLLNWI